MHKLMIELEVRTLAEKEQLMRDIKAFMRLQPPTVRAKIRHTELTEITGGEPPPTIGSAMILPIEQAIAEKDAMKG